MTITFHGAARTVTGSKHLLTLNDGKKILLDCGFFQGHGKDTDAMNRHFGFQPSEIDILVLSHAHIDHSGNIPNLVKQGFSGKIYCTTPTMDLCRIMLADTAHIQENDTMYLNKRRKKKGQLPLKPIYTMMDVDKVFKQFVNIPYNDTVNIADNVTLEYTNAGHILGAAAVFLTVTEGSKVHRIFFTGDIGRTKDRLLKTPEKFPQADYIICESTYGDKLHEPPERTEEELKEIIIRTCLERKGKLIIPAFSLGRTQEILYALNNLSNQRHLPELRVFVDSPLSVNVTEIMRRHLDSFNDEIAQALRKDPDPFDFPGLRYIHDAEESKKLNVLREPCVIISASGMAEAGRIKHHIKNNIDNPRNTILIAGYCTPESLGGKLAAGNKVVRIFGEEYNVKANVEVINSLSAHADYKEMLQYLGCQSMTDIKKVFLVHGEYPVQVEWSKKILAAGIKSVEIPEPGSIHPII